MLQAMLNYNLLAADFPLLMLVIASNILLYILVIAAHICLHKIFLMIYR